MNHPTTDILTIEFGNLASANHAATHYMLADIDEGNLLRKDGITEETSEVQLKTFRFSRLIQEAATSIKKSCLEKRRQMIPGYKAKESMTEAVPFYVIHLRATDRDCVRRLLSPQQVVDKILKIRSFRVFRRPSMGEKVNEPIVYLMTDLPSESEYVAAMKSAFRSGFCQAKDVDIFTRTLFKDDNYLVYATESQAARASDGYVKTYNLKKPSSKSIFLGALLNMKCGLDDRQKLANKSVIAI